MWGITLYSVGAFDCSQQGAGLVVGSFAAPVNTTLTNAAGLGAGAL
jgi:hypothetical protein